MLLDTLYIEKAQFQITLINDQVLDETKRRLKYEISFLLSKFTPEVSTSKAWRLIAAKFKTCGWNSTCGTTWTMVNFIR